MASERRGQRGGKRDGAGRPKRPLGQTLWIARRFHELTRLAAIERAGMQKHGDDEWHEIRDGQNKLQGGPPKETRQERADRRKSATGQFADLRDRLADQIDAKGNTIVEGDISAALRSRRRGAKGGEPERGLRLPNTPRNYGTRRSIITTVAAEASARYGEAIGPEAVRSAIEDAAKLERELDALDAEDSGV